MDVISWKTALGCCVLRISSFLVGQGLCACEAILPHSFCTSCACDSFACSRTKKGTELYSCYKTAAADQNPIGTEELGESGESMGRLRVISISFIEGEQNSSVGRKHRASLRIGHQPACHTLKGGVYQPAQPAFVLHRLVSLYGVYLCVGILLY